MLTKPFTFELPAELSAKEPPERRGIARDQVRLMVINRNTYQVEHTRFNSVSNFLRPGDLLVFNTSRTLPASLDGCEASLGQCIEIRLAQHLPDDSWLALVLCQQEPSIANKDLVPCPNQILHELTGRSIDFGQSLTATIESRDRHIPRLWKIRFSKSSTELLDLLYRLGRPIRYEYVSAPWDLDYYQTVYAKEPGSAEMPSAGRAFTWKLLFDLKRRGVETAQILLTTPARARKWIQLGKAIGKRNKVGVFYVQLTEKPSGYETQTISVGTDRGKCFTGIAFQTKMATIARHLFGGIFPRKMPRYSTLAYQGSISLKRRLKTVNLLREKWQREMN